MRPDKIDWFQASRNMKNAEKIRLREYQEILVRLEDEMSFNNTASIVAFPCELLVAFWFLQTLGVLFWVPIISYFFYHQSTVGKKEIKDLKEKIYAHMENTND